MIFLSSILIEEERVFFVLFLYRWLLFKDQNLIQTCKMHMQSARPTISFYL